MDTLWQDVRYGARMLRKSPGFTAVVVVTLALGIGANAAIFSVVNGVLMTPLPFPDPDRLMGLHQSKPNFTNGAITYPNFRDWQTTNQTFSSIAITRGFGFSLTGRGDAERVTARLVSADFFTVLGGRLALGRNFAPSEDQPGAGPVIIISTGLWQRKFGGAPDVAGKSLTLDDKSYTIIGVLPAAFPLFDSDVYALIGQWNAPAMRNRSAGLGLHGIGRLKPGVTLAQARADLDRVMRNLAAAYPEANQGNGATVIPLDEQLVGGVRLPLLLLLGAVGFVLLIACANVSNLLLARSTGRSGEFATRAALGADGRRLLRQSLTESTLLAMMGGGLGLLMAGWGTQAALSALPTALPRTRDVTMDWRVLVFTVAVSLIIGVLSGLAPAFRTSHGQFADTLKEGARGASGGRHRAQGVLVAIETALALVLLIGSGLMIRSLAALWRADPGFHPDNVLTFGLKLPPAMRTASEERARANLRDLSERLQAIPGVVAVSFSSSALPLLTENDLFFWIDGQPKPSSTSQMQMALVYRVEPGYLNAMGIPLVRGRFFKTQDDERSSRVVVIDEVFARRHFPNTDPVGHRINYGDGPLEIVGVVGHVKQWSLGADNKQTLQAQLYEPFSQTTGAPAGIDVVMRTGAAAPGVWDAIRRVVSEQNGQNVIFRSQTMTDVIAGSLAAQRFSTIVLDAFAAAALLLASVGTYGVISYLVGQRTRELGIRLALGAQRSDVVRLVVSHGMKMALSGVALGLVAAFGLTRLLTEMLYGVSATDPATFAGLATMLTAVALLACLVPAMRATRVDPIVALRFE
jgi:putative ABC transport system permease protein